MRTLLTRKLASCLPGTLYHYRGILLCCEWMIFLHVSKTETKHQSDFNSRFVLRYVHHQNKSDRHVVQANANAVRALPQARAAHRTSLHMTYVPQENKVLCAVVKATVGTCNYCISFANVHQSISNVCLPLSSPRPFWILMMEQLAASSDNQSPHRDNKHTSSSSSMKTIP